MDDGEVRLGQARARVNAVQQRPRRVVSPHPSAVGVSYTVFLPAQPELAAVSSTAVRSLRALRAE
ncbi:hypothetical protein AB0J94_27175 [Micromonospora noduli]|uniref:hypothetical protein n=1 Tax=Micromonospora noduli TaxID=709876 RepID=UPI00343184DA